MSTSLSGLSSNFFPSPQNGFTTTTSGSVASGAATVGLNSVSGYTNGQIVTLVIDPTDASKKQTFTGVVDTSGVQVTSVVWTAGTNQTHALGATVVDYATATHIGQITKGITQEHAQAGTHTNITQADANYIKDTSGNELLKWSTTASAVNEMTIKNAATGTSPSLRATGGDSNVDLLLGGKGTGSGRWSGIHDGWVDAFETLTYASATTFTCSATLAANLSVGDKIKLTQTTAKYFYITGISGTTITVNGGTDYSLANAAITLPYYSKESTPTGFPVWFAFTPTLTNVTTGNGTLVARFSMTGKTIFSRGSFTLGTTSSVGGAVQISFPVTASSTAMTVDGSVIGTGIAQDTGVFLYPLEAVYHSTTTHVLNARITVTGANPVYQDINTNRQVTTTVPITWGNTDQFNWQIMYEAA